MAAVVLENVSKIFPNGVYALRDLNLHVMDGELLVLVGPSGSGKTTALRLIAGLENPTRGTVRIGDRDVTHLTPRERDVALVFQRHTLYPHLTVRRNLSFGMDLRNASSEWPGSRFLVRWSSARRSEAAARQELMKQRVAETARFLELEDVLDRKPNQLSGGQQQRVALGRAMVRRPAVFLLDEPLSHLDFKLRSTLRRQLHLLHRRLPATMIHVTHDPTEAMILADRVVVIDQGIAQQVDRPMTVYHRPCNRQVAAFFGSPSMNFIDGVLTTSPEGLRLTTREGVLPVPDTVARGWLPHSGKALSLGVRPQHLQVVDKASGGDPGGWDMQVASIEALGATTLVMLQRGGVQLTVQQAHGLQTGGALAGEGQTMHVIIDMNRVHLFDRATGDALMHGRPEG